MRIIVCLLAFFNLSLHRSNAKFTNQVIYPSSSTQKVYKFDLHFEEGLSMSINQKEDGEFDPVDFSLDDGKFNVRNKDLFKSCNLSEPVVDKKQLDTIVTVDGRHRTMLFVNEQFPGPPIVVPKGAKVEITVHNHLRAESISIHWHGQTQKDSFQMDGVSRITQCPIAPGENFVYSFTATDLGTHWYHSHSSVQRTDGAIGPFIVYEPELERKEYEEEFYFFVQDWQHLRSEDTVNLPIWGNTKFWNGFEKEKECFYPLRIQDASMMMMKPDSFIINGKGWHYMPDKVDQLGDFINKAKILPLEQFVVKPNKKYLFRVIGSNMAFPIVISVNGHKINLVATDGNPIQKISNLDYLIINGGERYDFELETKEDSSRNFYIITQALASLDYNFNELNKDYFGVAILKYENSDNLVYVDRNCSVENKCLTANCLYLTHGQSKFECIYVSDMKSEDKHLGDFEKHLLFRSKFNKDEFEEHFFNYHFSGENILRSSVNGKQYAMPRLPPFFKENFQDSIKGMECPAKCTGHSATCHCSSKTEITPKKVIQFTIYNIGKGAGVQGTAHPVHMHGHHFYVMSMGFPTYYQNGTFRANNPDLNCAQDDSDFCNGVEWSFDEFKYGNISKANFRNPVKKDTVIVPVGGYVVVRFYSDNIGYWFFHCHVEVHATEGMATLIQEGTHEEIRNKVDWNDMHTCFKGYTMPKSMAKSADSVLKSNFSILFCFILILLFFLN